MAKKPNLFTTLGASTSEDWNSAGVWLAFTVGGGFLPFWIGLLAVWALSRQPVDWANFLVHGELAIYSASLIAATTRLIAKDVAAGPFVHRQLFTLVALIAMISAVVLYALIKAALFLHLQNTVNESFILRFSIPLIIVSLVFSFLVYILDHQRGINFRELAREEEEELGREFDKLGGEDGK